ncbi:hypothetical protein MRX96_011588 [Rhipicephalus microplus]
MLRAHSVDSRNGPRQNTALPDNAKPCALSSSSLVSPMLFDGEPLVRVERCGAAVSGGPLPKCRVIPIRGSLGSRNDSILGFTIGIGIGSGSGRGTGT